MQSAKPSGACPATRISPACPKNPITCWCWCRRVLPCRSSGTPRRPARARRPSSPQVSANCRYDSQKLATELQQAIRETGLAFTGPNCLGNLSAGEKLFTNIDDRVVTMEAGPVAIAGQSGAIVMAIRQALEDRGAGVGYMVTTGNEAGLETPDLMSYFAADPSVRVIVVYLEGVRNTKIFREACK